MPMLAMTNLAWQFLFAFVHRDVGGHERGKCRGQPAVRSQPARIEAVIACILQSSGTGLEVERRAAHVRDRLQPCHGGRARRA